MARIEKAFLIRGQNLHRFGILIATALLFFIDQIAVAAQPRSVSGIYPHLAMFNDELECGTGAVVPWADRLWVVSYAPHQPKGSSDKLYEITPALEQIIRPESIGGTPANRMIHRESRQLFIGPYAIDSQRKVRAIPYTQMFGRLTANARHLTDPKEKIYYATMEEGFYEVDVKTLAVTELWADEQMKDGRKVDLPGHHGKGLYSGQGRLIYANNGERSVAARSNPTVTSGVLAEWDGREDNWNIIRRNQFTEVTGPGGIFGNEHPDGDPVWSIGWDHRSLILEVLDRGKWHSFRLPKGSHSYDGTHGWNTEWPRIRDIGENELLMTMHGTFWRFPKSFSAGNSSGITPRSNYLKVIGDFCRWNDRVVFGCDDAAKSEFLNKRKAKGEISGPGRSQSNLWFVEPDRLDALGPALGRGAVWLNEDVKANAPSDAFLFYGYFYRGLHLSQQSGTAINFTLEIDRNGNGKWHRSRDVEVPAHGYVWTEFDANEKGAWIRVSANRDCSNATASFDYRNKDTRSTNSTPIFTSLAKSSENKFNGGLLHARGENLNTLRFLANNAGGELGCYDLDGEFKLRKTNDLQGVAWMKKNVAIPKNVLVADAASVIYVDDNGKRWRLPKGNATFDGFSAQREERVCREVCTERDLFNAGGTFYELPAENAGGFAKIRPIATHNRSIKDYVSYRGLLVLSGLSDHAHPNEHTVFSEDGQCALWVGAVDDLWQLGKPCGIGGPWKNTTVESGKPSDPYLMTGYDKKSVSLSHSSTDPLKFRLEVDIAGNGSWVLYREFSVVPNETVEYQFPHAFGAYWVRLSTDKATEATALFNYK